MVLQEDPVRWCKVVSDGSTWRVPSVGEDDVRLSGGVR
jgi:hypothetical protein